MKTFNLLEDNNKNNTIELMRNLLVSPSWVMLTDLIQQNIAYLTEVLIAKSEDGIQLTPEQMEEVRYKIQIFREVKNTPNRLLGVANLPEAVVTLGDPYLGDLTQKELEKEEFSLKNSGLDAESIKE